MAIDYAIDYPCTPKRTLTTPGILARLKGRDRARRVIQLYREADDDRPYDQMGFEFTRSTPEGEEVNEVVLVSELIAAARQLDDYAHHCEGCPANITGAPYGCFGRVAYPISDHAERWLLMQLPKPPDAPLIWTLLKEHLREINEHAAEGAKIRASGAYFESDRNPRRPLGEIALSGDNVFYLLFLGGHISASRAAVLMLFFDAIPRNIDASQMVTLTPAPEDAADQHPFQLAPDPDIDDGSVSDLKAFFRALYAAWTLNVDLLLDV